MLDNLAFSLFLKFHTYTKQKTNALFLPKLANTFLAKSNTIFTGQSKQHKHSGKQPFLNTK